MSEQGTPIPLFIQEEDDYPESEIMDETEQEFDEEEGDTCNRQKLADDVKYIINELKGEIRYLMHRLNDEKMLRMQEANARLTPEEQHEIELQKKDDELFKLKCEKEMAEMETERLRMDMEHKKFHEEVVAEINSDFNRMQKFMTRESLSPLHLFD